MPIEQRDNFGIVGVPHKWTDTVAKELENLVTGSFPEVSGQDFTVGPSTTLSALTVVALNASGRIVQAQANFDAPGDHASGTITATGGAGSAVTVGGVAYSAAASVGNANARAADLARQMNEDVDGPVYATVANAVVTAYARGPGTGGNSIGITAGTGTTRGAASLAGGTGGNVSLGILVEDVATGASETHQAGVYLTGVFNPDRLTWHSSFGGANSLVRRVAFANARPLTQITLRKIRANTVT